MWHFIQNNLIRYRTGGTLLLVFLVVGTGVAFNTKTIMFPGPISGLSRHGEDIQGYHSHASFEEQCSHCHAPVHCVTDTRCQDCHLEVARQRSEAVGLHSRLPGTERCQSCHVEHRGREVMITEFAFLNVDHTKLSGFSLEQHLTDYDGEPMHCDSCHDQQRFIQETLDCLTCHAQEDHELMALHIERYGLDCLACHDGVDRYSDFDHDDSYVLDGAHLDVACLDCHLEQQYAGISRTCAGCHQDPQLHLGAFGSDCTRCHTTTAWRPAFLVGHTFDLEHGDTGLLECQTCHIDAYYANTCYGCHDHLEEEITAGHLADGYEEIGKCWDCHPTGVEGEAGELLKARESGIGH